MFIPWQGVVALLLGESSLDQAPSKELGSKEGRRQVPVRKRDWQIQGRGRGGPVGSL